MDRQTLEDRRVERQDLFTLVEYPGRIESRENAMRRLTFRQGAVELRFNPDDPWRPPVQGDLHSHHGLLLKVTRQDGVPSQGEILGKISRVARFRRLADFRMAPPEETTMERTILETAGTLDLEKFEALAKTLADKNWRAEQALERRMLAYAPPRFTSSDFPFQFATLSASAIASESGRRKGRQAAWTRCYADISIPEEAPKDISYRVRRLHRADFDKLQELFRRQPVWLRSALKHHMPDIGPTEFRAMMPAVAYFFLDGPWRCCWVRYGYDPRSDPDARRHQVVEMRATKIQSMIDSFPPLLRRAAEAAPEKHIFDGLHILSIMSQFQYCDLTFPPIQDILNNRQNFRDACDRKEGWFVDGTIKRIRFLIKARWFDMVRQIDPAFYEAAMAEAPAGNAADAAEPDGPEAEGLEGNTALTMEELDSSTADEGTTFKMLGTDESEYEIYE